MQSESDMRADARRYAFIASNGIEICMEPNGWYVVAPDGTSAEAGILNNAIDDLMRAMGVQS